jgi:hypothetical protein
LGRLGFLESSWGVLAGVPGVGCRFSLLALCVSSGDLLGARHVFILVWVYVFGGCCGEGY